MCPRVPMACDTCNIDKLVTKECVRCNEKWLSTFVGRRVHCWVTSTANQSVKIPVRYEGTGDMVGDDNKIDPVRRISGFQLHLSLGSVGIESCLVVTVLNLVLQMCSNFPVFAR